MGLANLVRPRSIVVVGAGVVGLCSAYELAKRGHHVTVLDRSPAGAESCSTGNAGMVVPSHFTPLAAPGMVSFGLRMALRQGSPFGFGRLTPALLDWSWKFLRAANAGQAERSAPIIRDLNLASRSAYERLTEELGDFGFARKGLSMICATAKALEEEAHLAKEAARLGLEVEVLDRAELARREPDLRIEAQGAVHYGCDAQLSPKAFIKVLRDKLDQMNVRVRQEAPVVGWNLGQGRVAAAVTPQGEEPADEFVLAAGALSMPLAQGLGLNLPIVSGKGYGFTVPDPPGTLRSCAILCEGRVAAAPMLDGFRFTGTMELGGAEGTVSQSRLEGIYRSVAAYFPDFASLDLAQFPVWTGARPCSPDGLPFLGRSRRWDNLVVASGHSMMGMSLGPISGEMVAQIVSQEATLVPLHALDPDRYA